MRFAYADPPYIGQAKKHYSHDERCAEVDHAALIGELVTYDGFALSCKSDLYELRYLTGLFKRALRRAGRSDVKPRNGSWFKPFCAYKKNVNPAYAFEVVIWYSPRRRTCEQDTVRDWVEAPAVKESITLKRGLVGVKPQKFSFWLFEILNMKPEDEFVDMFPGTGAVSEAWEAFKSYHATQPGRTQPALSFN